MGRARVSRKKEEVTKLLRCLEYSQLVCKISYAYIFKYSHLYQEVGTSFRLIFFFCCRTYVLSFWNIVCAHDVVDSLWNTVNNCFCRGGASRFAFTRQSVVLLEKVSVCVSKNEPVLLVGETGTGKTSSVQYLAQQTGRKQTCASVHCMVIIDRYCKLYRFL